LKEHPRTPDPAADPAQPADAELMRRLAGGDMQALASLVHRHQDRVRALAFRMTGRWDVADDLTQEAFLRVYRSAARYVPAAAFSTWLYRIVVNLCLDRSKRLRPAATPDDWEPGQTAPSAEESLVRQEKIDAVRREVADLPERQRAALILHRFELLSHAQIAEITGWSESSVESLLVRAYVRLRERLKPWAEA
jgi:RNA polymerase sigma-70 factor, ECF subfamily